MTHVTFFRNVDRKYIGFKVEGHANYAEHGKDIVCAGVSTITQCTVHGVEQIVRAETMKTVSPKNAVISLRIVERGNKHDVAELFIETMAFAIGSMAEQYPAYVSFETVDEDIT